MRTTVQLVKDILDETVLDDTTIESFIDSANVFVTNAFSGLTVGATILAEIERWVSAHMIVSTRERVALKEGAGTAYIHYAGEWGKGLLGTSYGQMAVTLDTTGTLADLAKIKSKASIRAIPNFDD